MAEQLLLDVVNGPLKGQTFVVPANTDFQVGRLPECSLCISDDLTVSRQHFRIEFHPPACRLVHVSQTAPTSLNDTPVTEARLNEGDEITFGLGNRLKLRFVQRSTRAGQTTMTFEGLVAAKIPSGWNEFHGSSEHPKLDEILTFIESHGNFGAVIDFQRLGGKVPDELGTPVPLFGWLSPDLAAQHSPALFWSDNSPELGNFVEQNWGKDALVCFASDLTDEQALDHWRTAIGAAGNQAGNALTAYFWPSLLEMILSHQSSNSVRFLLSKFKWLLIESAERDCRWKFFCNEDFKSVIQSAGLHSK